MLKGLEPGMEVKFRDGKVIRNGMVIHITDYDRVNIVFTDAMGGRTLGSFPSDHIVEILTKDAKPR